MTKCEEYVNFRSKLPETVNLVAVSKTRSEEEILALYWAGHRHFGENRVQELTGKYGKLPTDIKWHLVGHLQTNKVKYIAPFVHLIHSVDSLKLLKTINKEAFGNKRIVGCLLQFFIAEEETKFGLDLDEAMEILKSNEYSQLHNIKVNGVMGMATFTNDMDKVRREFKKLKSIFDVLREKFFGNDAGFCEISMGMSDDYKVAIEEGSTILRVGSAIFGPRS